LQLETRKILEGLTRRITIQGYSLKTAPNRIVCDKCWLVQLIPSQFGSRLNSYSGGYSSRLRVRSSLQEWGTNSSDIQLIPTSIEPNIQKRSFFVRIVWHLVRALCPKQNSGSVLHKTVASLKECLRSTSHICRIMETHLGEELQIDQANKWYLFSYSLGPGSKTQVASSSTNSTKSFSSVQSAINKPLTPGM